MAIALPPPPASGGHYVLVGGKPQLIHAVGKGKWAPGPPPKAPTIAPANPLLNPSTPLSGKSLLSAAQALTNQQTDPAINALAQQIAQRQTQGSQAQAKTSGYFQGLGNLVNQSNQQLGGISTGLNQQLQGIGQDAQSRLVQLGQSNQASMTAHAPQGEGGLSGSATSALASALAQQQGLAAQNSQTAQSAGATQGANYQSLGATNLANYALRGQEALKGIGAQTQAALQPLSQQAASLQANKGALLAKNEGSLRQQEINNAITATGLGIKQQDILAQNQRSQAQIDAQNQRNAASNAQSDLNNQRTTSTSAANNAASNATSTANGLASAFGGVFKAAANAAKQPAAKPLTPSENNSYWSHVSAGTSAYGQARQAGHSPQQIISALQSGTLSPHLGPMSDLQALAVYELWTYHYLNPQTAGLLHRSGVRGGTYNGQPVRVGAPSKKPVAPLNFTGGSLSQGA